MRLRLLEVMVGGWEDIYRIRLQSSMPYTTYLYILRGDHLRSIDTLSPDVPQGLLGFYRGYRWRGYQSALCVFCIFALLVIGRACVRFSYGTVCYWIALVLISCIGLMGLALVFAVVV